MARDMNYYKVLSYGQKRMKVYDLVREKDGVIIASSTRITALRRIFIRKMEEGGRPYKGGMFVCEHTDRGNIRIEDLRSFEGLSTYPFLGTLRGVGDRSRPTTINRINADGTLGAVMFSSDWEW